MKKSAGFSLIELMIVVVVVAILARVAIGGYQESVNKSRRSEATTSLLEAAQQLERYYSANGRYVTTAGGSTLASVYSVQVPKTGTAYYTVAAQGTPTDTTYVLRATRTGVMASDKCGDFEITQSGEHRLNSNTNTFDQCWRR